MLLSRLLQRGHRVLPRRVLLILGERTDGGIGLSERLHGAIIPDSSLPSSPFGDVWMEIGISAWSDRLGISWCFVIQRRTAPAETLMTTSLTVVPAAFLMSLTLSSETSPYAQRR